MHGFTIFDVQLKVMLLAFQRQQFRTRWLGDSLKVPSCFQPSFRLSGPKRTELSTLTEFDEMINKPGCCLFGRDKR